MDIFGIFGIFLLIIFIFMFFYFIPIQLWVTALASRVRVSLVSLIGMRLRKISPALIVNALINARKAGLDINTNQLETHYLAGGNVGRVVLAMIAADKAGIPLTFQRATAIDLAGRNVLDAVQTSVNPKVIDCPAQGKISAVAKDGIQLHARARVTVRANIERLVGGAVEETIIARVGEGIVSAIGSCDSHKQVLANPQLIAAAVMKKGLDAQTAYEIVSIDIADIDVGDNIGARLQADQAEADKRVARARAEQRRAEAVASEQENRALTQENRAKVVLAEAEIPKAMAEAFERGQLLIGGAST